MKKYFMIAALLLTLAVSFQNCAPSNQMKAANMDSATGVNPNAVTDSKPATTNNVVEYTYSPSGFDRQKLESGSSAQYLNVNLKTWVISKKDSLGAAQVSILEGDKSLAQSVFNQVRLCKEVLPEDSVSCMAYSMPDNVFIDSTGSSIYVATTTKCNQERLCSDSRDSIKQFLARYNINF
jgi:hypothetical protein